MNDFEYEEEDNLYITSLWMCSMIVDNLAWELMTSGLQDSDKCATMMEQIQGLQELISSTLALSEVNEETMFH